VLGSRHSSAAGDRLLVCFETSDPVNPPIYERFGFETIIHVTDAAWLPGLWVMRRDPVSRRETRQASSVRVLTCGQLGPSASTG